MRISDWSSDVCSSDVAAEIRAESIFNPRARSSANARGLMQVLPSTGAGVAKRNGIPYGGAESLYDSDTNIAIGTAYLRQMEDKRSEEHTSELQSLMRISYAVFCLKKKNNIRN